MITPERQYSETYERFRQHDRFIWQIPSIVVVVNGVTVATAYSLDIPWWVREFIFFFVVVLTAVLILALVKHRFFVELEERTLLALEARYAERFVQRMTEPRLDGIEPTEAKKGFWAENRNPSRLERQSAHRFFASAMSFILVLMFALLFINPLVSVCPMPAAVFWAVIGFGILMTGTLVICVVCLLRTKPSE